MIDSKGKMTGSQAKCGGGSLSRECPLLSGCGFASLQDCERALAVSKSVFVFFFFFPENTTYFGMKRKVMVDCLEGRSDELSNTIGHEVGIMRKCGARHTISACHMVCPVNNVPHCCW